MRTAATVVAGAALISVLAVLCLVVSSNSRTELLTSSQALYYNDAGLSYEERQAIQKSKDLARKVARGEKEDPSIVDSLMKNIKKYENRLSADWNFGIQPALIRAGLRQQGAAQNTALQQLRVVMTECVKCVSECPAWVHKPFETSSFDEFQRKAKDECPMCYHSVAGPCPASRNNHGVMEKERKMTVLHDLKARVHAAAAKGGKQAKGEKASSASKWSTMMGTNRVFLGKTFKNGVESRSLERAAAKASSYGVEA